MPSVPADELETIVWGSVFRAILDPRNLNQGLNQDGNQVDTLTQRIDGLDRDIWKLRGKIRQYAGQIADARRGSELAKSLQQLADEAETAIARLSRERDQLERERSQELSTDAIDSLVAFARSIGDDLEDLIPSGRRDTYRSLNLRGSIRIDDENKDAIPIGRIHRYTVDLPAWIPLLNAEQHQYSQKNCSAYSM